MADETRVEIVIEASSKTGAVSVAAADLEKLERKMTLTQIEANKMNASFEEAGKASESLQDKLLQLTSAAALGEFFKAAVEESLHEAEALRVLKGSVESTGASWEKYKDQIEAFAKAQQDNTRFQDDVTYEVLGKLARATSTVGEAMRATALAQNIAVATGVPLAETVSIVNQLLLGQERAVKSATREFGNYAGGATTAQEALDNLQRTTSGLAETERSAAKDFAQMKAAWGDTIQIVGDALIPVLSDMAVAIRDILKATQEHLGFTEKLTDAHKAKVRVLQEEKDALIASASSLGSHGAATEENTKEQERLREAIRLKTAELENAQKAEDKASGGPGGSDLKARQGVAEAEKAAADKLAIEQKLNDEILQGTETEFDFKRIKMEEELAQATKLGVDKVTIEATRSVQMADIYKQETAAKAKELKVQAVLDEQKKKDFAATLQFISTLSTSKNKELAMIGKVAGIANAYINTGVAVTRALAAAPPPFNFVLAAAVGAAGAAQIATIAGVQLKKGAYVPGSAGGVQATIGEENRDEAVIPLEDSRAMNRIGKAIGEQMGAGGSSAGGGGTTIINLNVNATLEYRAIMNALAEEAANGSPEIIRLARRLGDLNELHAGRAS